MSSPSEGLAFLQFGGRVSPVLSLPSGHQSWGETTGAEPPAFPLHWWRVVFPTLTLLVATAAVTVFAGALQRILDSRGE